MLYNFFETLCNKAFSSKKNIFFFLSIGLTIRLIPFISDGHNSDFDFFETWAQQLYQFGFTNIYNIRVDRFACDYPPLYLYVLSPMAHLFHFFNWEISSHTFDSFLKFFTLIFEVIFLLKIFKITKNKKVLFLLILSPVIIINAYASDYLFSLYCRLCLSYILFIITLDVL